MIDLTDDEIDDILKGIYIGKITPENLPENLYAAIAEKLKSGLYKGFGGSLKDIESTAGYGSAPAELLVNLRENIYLFAGAKTFHQTEEMRGLLVKDGKVITESEFLKQAKETYDRYNKTWMESEYNTAVGQGESARMWDDFQADKHLFPFLRYIAVMDANTSTICRPLNNITLPVDDPFWNTFMPLNHYNCRCVVEKLEKEDATVTHPDKVKESGNEVKSKMNDAFKMNPGKTGEVFGKDHPYFKEVPKQYKDLAENNFNLPIPKIKPKFTPEIFEEWGLDLNNDVFELLNTEMKVFESKKGSFASSTKSEINIEKGVRWKGSEVHQKQVIYHETGHVIHTQKKLIYFGHSVSDEYSKHFNSLKSLVINPSEIDTKLNSIMRTTLFGSDVENAELIKKYGVKTKYDVREYVSSASDSLMALTNSRFGGGHTKNYFKIKGAKEAEVFAHSIENAFMENPIFKEVMPDVYNESVKYINELMP